MGNTVHRLGPAALAAVGLLLASGSVEAQQSSTDQMQRPQADQTTDMPATQHQENVLEEDEDIQPGAGSETGMQTPPGTPAPGTAVPSTEHQREVLDQDKEGARD
jgi:hypothetical protein